MWSPAVELQVGAQMRHVPQSVLPRRSVWETLSCELHGNYVSYIKWSPATLMVFLLQNGVCLQ